MITHGTGALNIDGCRVGTSKDVPTSPSPGGQHGAYSPIGALSDRGGMDPNTGRWPANVVLDDTQAAELDAQTSHLHLAGNKGGTPRDLRNFSAGERGTTNRIDEMPASPMDQQVGASRFFPTFRYEAKAPTAERPRDGETAHPTVKPLDLMRWLVRLVTPPGGVVLEPFAGSGTTAEACVIEGFRCIAIEREADYLPLIVSRLSKPLQLGLDLGEAS
ncbi:site-specific DNA-methyltransferase [Antribacter gilvus]|uniref:site-specific DNA-methyltransferase n=1 Tax=Antribacter gilvus TaxID=2304675 RepID=UPI001F0C4192|nr:site-specific DNA-methyltransferase [Antribacter gilvus]